MGELATADIKNNGRHSFTISPQSPQSTSTVFSEIFPKRSNFWSLVSRAAAAEIGIDTPLSRASSHHPSIFDIFKNSENRQDFINKLGCSFPTSSREIIERLTRGQSANHIWFEYRKMTITGSKVHLLNNAAKFGRVLSIHAQNLLMGEGERELNFPPVIYGRNNEPVARCNFIARKTRELPGFLFQERGMYLDKIHPFIAASVDGLYSFDAPHDDDDVIQSSKISSSSSSSDCCGHFSPGFSNDQDDLAFSLMDSNSGPATADTQSVVTRLLEIKCPYLLKDTGLWKRGGVDKLKYLERNSSSENDTTAAAAASYRLKKSSAYYTQIQLYLQVYDLDICTLLIWTPYDFLELNIERDRRFGETLFSNLSQFYREKFIPALDFSKK